MKPNAMGQWEMIESAVARIAAELPETDLSFFRQIKESGEIDGRPFVRLYNNNVLFGISDYKDTYYRGHFERFCEEFEHLGIREVAFGAAFDALELYHYENCNRSYLKKTDFIKAGDVVLDVGVRGAHFAVKASPLVGPFGKILEIDPTSFSKEFTGLHVSHNSLKNVVFVEAVVGDTVGEQVNFYSGSTGESLSGLYPRTISREGIVTVSDSAHTQVNTFETKTIDYIISSFGISRCDLIILQINGSELKALQGAEDTLRYYKPALHMAAYQASDVQLNDKDPVENICEYVSQFGYNLVCNKWNGEAIFGQTLVLA